MRGRKPSANTLAKSLVDESLPIEPPPDAPDWLDADARDEWYRVVPLLAARRILAQLDVQLLSSYCQTYAQWKRFTLRMRIEGETVVGGNGELKLHPCAKHTIQLMQEMRRLAAEFGFTPVARSRAKAADTLPPKDDNEDFD